MLASIDFRNVSNARRLFASFNGSNWNGLCPAGGAGDCRVCHPAEPLSRCAAMAPSQRHRVTTVMETICAQWGAPFCLISLAAVGSKVPTWRRRRKDLSSHDFLPEAVGCRTFGNGPAATRVAVNAAGLDEKLRPRASSSCSRLKKLTLRSGRYRSSDAKLDIRLELCRAPSSVRRSGLQAAR